MNQILLPTMKKIIWEKLFIQKKIKEWTSNKMREMSFTKNYFTEI